MCGVPYEKINQRPGGWGGGGDQRFCVWAFRRPAMTCISNVFVVEFISQGVLSGIRSKG